MGSAHSSTASRNAPNAHDIADGVSEFDHLASLPEDSLLRIFLFVPPIETGCMLSTCRSLSNIAHLAWRLKCFDAASEDDKPLIEGDGVNNSSPAHWRRELAKAMKRQICTRPSIDAFGGPPHWYPNHPEPTSPFRVVARCHDVTEFCITAKSRSLEEGTYAVSWRACSTSGFCVLQLAHTVVSPDGTRSRPVTSGVWNTKDDRGSGWKTVTAGNGSVHVGPEGGFVEGRIFKQNLEFAGRLLVDYMEVKKLESVEPPLILQSTLLTSNW